MGYNAIELFQDERFPGFSGCTRTLNDNDNNMLSTVSFINKSAKLKWDSSVLL